MDGDVCALRAMADRRLTYRVAGGAGLECAGAQVAQERPVSLLGALGVLGIGRVVDGHGRRRQR